VKQLPPPPVPVDATLALLLGRLRALSGRSGREAEGPKLSLLIGAVPYEASVLLLWVLLLMRLRLLRTVTLAGMPGVWWPRAELRGDPRGVLVGAGSFERTVWTRSSSFCIFPIRPRIWYREPERGSGGCSCPMLGRDGTRLLGADGGGRDVVGMEGPRECLGGRIALWLGLRIDVEAAAGWPFGNGVEGATKVWAGASERGGDGGVACSVGVSDLARGGVDVVGHDVDVAEVAVSESGEGGRRTSPSSCEGLRW